MISLAFPSVIREMYKFILIMYKITLPFLSDVQSSPAFREVKNQFVKWFLVLSSSLQDILSSPLITEAADHAGKICVHYSFHFYETWMKFLEEHPGVKAQIDFFMEAALGTSHALKMFLYDTTEKVLQHPELQNVKEHTHFQYLANHPLLQSVFEHRIFQDNYPVKTMSHQFGAVSQSFMNGITVHARKAHDDSNIVKMNIFSRRGDVDLLVAEVQALKDQSMAADILVWICGCVVTMVVVTSLSWLAIMLSTRGSNYRNAVHVIALFVTAILTSFFLLFSQRLRSLDEDAYAVFKFLLASSYIPFLIIVAIVYFRTWGMRVKQPANEGVGRATDHDKVLEVLRKQLKDSEATQAKALSEIDTLNESNRLSREASEKMSSEQKTRLTVLDAELAAAQNSKEEAYRLLVVEQQRAAASASKRVVVHMDMDMDSSLDSQMAPSESRKVSTGRPKDSKSTDCTEMDMKIAAIQSESAREVKDLMSKLAAAQEELAKEKAVQEELVREKAALIVEAASLTEKCLTEESSRADGLKDARGRQSEHDKVVGGLRKLVREMESSQLQSISDSTALKESMRISREEFEKISSDQKTRLKTLRAELASSREESSKELTAEHLQVTVLVAEKATLQSSLDGLKVELEANRKATNTQKDSLTEVTGQLSVLAAEKATLQSSLDGLKVVLETTKKSSLALKESLSTVTSELVIVKEEKGRMEKELDSVKLSITQSAEGEKKSIQMQRIEHNTAVASLNAQLKVMEEAHAQSLSDTDVLKESMRISREQFEKISSDQKSNLKALRAELAATQAAKDDVDKKAAVVLTEMEAVQNAYNGLKLQTGASRVESLALTESLSAVAAELDSERSKSIRRAESEKRASAAHADAVREAKDIAARLTAAQEELVREKAALSAEVASLTVRCKAEESARADSVKQSLGRLSDHDHAAAVLRKQLADMETSQAKALLDSRLHREASEKMSTEQRTRLAALTAELAAAQNSKEEVVKQMLAEHELTVTASAADHAHTHSILSGLRSQLEANRKVTHTQKDSLTEVTGQLSVLAAEKATLQSSLDGLKVELEANRKATNTQKDSLTEVTGQLSVLAAEKATLQSSLDGLKVALEVSKKVTLTLKNDLSKATGELEIEKSNGSQLADGEKRSATLQADTAREVRDLGSRLAVALDELASLTSRCTETEERLKVAGDSNTALLSERDSVKKQLAVAEAKLVAATANVADQAAAIEKKKADEIVLQKQLKEVEQARSKLEDECRITRVNLDTTTQQMKILEGMSASNLVMAKDTLNVSEGEKKVVSEEREALKVQCAALTKDLEESRTLALGAEKSHATAIGDLSAKLASSQDSWRQSTLDCTAAREQTKSISEDLDKQLTVKSTEVSNLQIRVREVEGAKAVCVREADEAKARLTAQLLKNAADSASSEEELRDVEAQLKSFVDICNTTRLSLVGVQNDLRTSEARRTEDLAGFQVKLKEADQARIALVDRCEADRLKLVALEVQAIAAASTGETGLDHLQGLLEASELERQRITLQGEELKSQLKALQVEVAELQQRREMDLCVLQGQLEEVQKEKQASTTEQDSLAVRLSSALEMISFYENEREDDLATMQKELKASANARKQIIADFDVARTDLKAAEDDLRKSRPVSPARSLTGQHSYPNSPRNRTPEMERSPALAVLENAVLKQTIDELTLDRDGVISDVEVLQTRLSHAMSDLDLAEAHREGMQMMLESLEKERTYLIVECDAMRRQLVGMSTVSSPCGNEVRTVQEKGLLVVEELRVLDNEMRILRTQLKISPRAGADSSTEVFSGKGADVDRAEESVAVLKRILDEMRASHQILRSQALTASEKRASPLLFTPARPVSTITISKSSSRDFIPPSIAISNAPSPSSRKDEESKAQAMGMMANPMLRKKTASSSSIPIGAASELGPAPTPAPPTGPQPLIMMSNFQWGNPKTTSALLSRRRSMPSMPVAALADASTVQIGESVKQEIDSLRKVKQTLELNLQSAGSAIKHAVTSSQAPASWSSPSSKSVMKDLKTPPYSPSDSDNLPLNKPVVKTESRNKEKDKDGGDDEDWRLNTAMQHPRSAHGTGIGPDAPDSLGSSGQDGDLSSRFNSPFSNPGSSFDSSPTNIEARRIKEGDVARGASEYDDSPSIWKSVGGVKGGVGHYDDLSPPESEAATPDECGSPLATTVHPFTNLSVSHSPPQPTGQALLKPVSNLFFKPRFVTSGGPLDPIPPPRSSKPKMSRRHSTTEIPRDIE